MSQRQNLEASSYLGLAEVQRHGDLAGALDLDRGVEGLDEAGSRLDGEVGEVLHRKVVVDRTDLGAAIDEGLDADAADDAGGENQCRLGRAGLAAGDVATDSVDGEGRFIVAVARIERGELVEGEWLLMIQVSAVFVQGCHRRRGSGPGMRHTEGAHSLVLKKRAVVLVVAFLAAVEAGARADGKGRGVAS